MSYRIGAACILCGACAAECPEQAVREEGGRFLIASDACNGCGGCAEACPVGACHRGE